MKQSALPVAIGLVASIAVPLQAAANDAVIDPTAIASSEVPVQPDAQVAQASAATPNEPTSAVGTADTGAMPVAQEKFYVEPSGALNFEPPQGTATSALSSAPVEFAPAEVASAPAADAAITSRPIAPAAAAPPSPNPPVAAGTDATTSNQDLFAGGSESLVARTVGAAEGTRTPDGGKTQNYHGHVDPGNGVWNRGTFSYQFGNSENLSPDEADRRQLAKIKRIYESVMLAKAEKHGVAPLTLAEEINGIDLINQAPLAVTEDGGYIERLAVAKQKGLTGDEAILDARIWAFWDGERGGWDAPGLRAYDDISKEESIRRDQDRRMAMIAKALEAYEQETKTIAQRPASNPQPAIKPMAYRQPSAPNRAAIADAIIFGERSATRG